MYSRAVPRSNPAPETPGGVPAPADARVQTVIERYRTEIVNALLAALEDRHEPPYAQMRYHLGWQDREGRPIEGRSGKLLRPALCLLACEAVGGDWRRALPAAAAIELLHNFTLIHDDVEDDSEERHGRATLWTIWGRDQAINVGDGMFALAHVTILGLQEQGYAPPQTLRAVQMLDAATLHLCEGQQADLALPQESGTTREAYLQMIEGKTAALLAACAGIGALLGGGSDETVAALTEFGRRLGFAFQIQDDVLGIWGDTAMTGKPVDDDLRARKRSYPIVIALERGSPDVRRTLQGFLAKEALDEADIAGVCALLEELGAREESERTARGHAQAAIASLAGLQLQDEHRAELTALAQFAVDRRA